MSQKSDTLPLHTHKCGFENDKFDPTRGCGHEWKHSELSPKKRRRPHHCPQCGRGPWMQKFEHEEEIAAFACRSGISKVEAEQFIKTFNRIFADLEEE